MHAMHARRAVRAGETMSGDATVTMPVWVALAGGGGAVDHREQHDRLTRAPTDSQKRPAPTDKNAPRDRVAQEAEVGAEVSGRATRALEAELGALREAVAGHAQVLSSMDLELRHLAEAVEVGLAAEDNPRGGV